MGKLGGMLRAAVLGVVALHLACAARGAAAVQTDLLVPAGSGEFGRKVTVLPNGNIVVTDPRFDAPDGTPDVGAVHLHRPDGLRVSTLRGSRPGDQVGGGVTVLANGNFVVCSPVWDNGSVVDAGAATFVSATTGRNGTVSVLNSLVGGSANDRVCSDVTALSNGNYVVQSESWNNGIAAFAGAVTFGSGVSGVSGVVSPENSLVGSSSLDQVGQFVVPRENGNYLVRVPDWNSSTAVDVGAVAFGSGTNGASGALSAANALVGTHAGDRVGASITRLRNSNCVIRSPDWDNGTFVDAGAATFVSGASGVHGEVAPHNSLVGTSTRDQIGRGGALALTNDAYVVLSPLWDSGGVPDLGAATFVSATGEPRGAVSASNSLTGSSANDGVGSTGAALSNGNYVVCSPSWGNGPIGDVGAATFGSSTAGARGAVSPANSLIGSSAGDQVCERVVALANGNYVVLSPSWNNGGLADVGAATWASGTTGLVGVVSPSNSLIGINTRDQVGEIATPLSNGNYVVASPRWDLIDVADVGAATFALGTTSTTGVVSPTNSLVGAKTGDLVGFGGVDALSTGNYVVRSPVWGNELRVRAGAVTFGSGLTGVVGTVSPANSLVGDATDDEVGREIRLLSNGNYVVASPFWNNGSAVDAGAVTFGSGTSGVHGLVSPANSLVGSTARDQVGRFLGGTGLPNGNYAINSDSWTNGAVPAAGAVTLGLADGSVVGPITATHGVLGSVSGGLVSPAFGYDAFRNQLAVGLPAENRVIIHRTGLGTSTVLLATSPDPSLAGEPITVVARVTGVGSAPADGQVHFVAGTDERCIAAAPTPISPTTSEFSCSLVFITSGLKSVTAEYVGSVRHAYSGSNFDLHQVTPNFSFADGFETP